MKTDKLHFVDYLSVGLLVLLLFFTVFSSNYLSEKRVVNIKADGDWGDGGFSDVNSDNYVFVPEQGVDYGTYTPETQTVDVNTGDLVTTTSQVEKDAEGGGDGGGGGGGLTPPSQLNAEGVERFNSMSREDQQAVIDAYNRGGKLGDGSPGIENATAGNSGTPKAANGSTANSLGSQLLNSLANSLLKGLTSSGSSGGSRASSTGTSSTGTTSTGTSSTGTTTSTTGTSNTASSAESLGATNGTTVTFNMSLMFQGITKKPVDNLNKMKVKVLLVDTLATTSKKSALAHGDFVANASGVWTGTVTFTDVVLRDGYYLLVKGPKHLQKRICSPSDVVLDIDGAGCNGTFTLTQTSMTIDLSKNSLAVGDLPTQDSVANVKDLGVIKTAFGKVDWSSLNSYDLNLDGFINSLDYSLIIQTMLRNSNDQT